MVAIFTKYLGPTNYRGSRVKAYTDQGEFSLSKTVSWDDALDPEQNHIRAAEALAKEKNWKGTWCVGAAEKGYVFVNSLNSDFVTFAV